MIFKVQIPLATNEPVPMALIYNEDRSIKHFVPITNEIKALMRNKFKAYFHVKFNATKMKFEFTGQAPAQEW